MAAKRKAIGIVRVSQVNGREGESFASPDEQRERIEAACERDGIELLDVLDELDVSGGTALAKRAGLRTAVERIEAGEAQVLVAAYFDRLMRSLRVQGELVERVEAAGGQVLAVDVGQVTNGSAGQWLSGTMLGAVSEYQRRATSERTADAQRRAVERGVPPLANIPPGYRRGPDGRLVVESREAPIVAKAFKMRAGGATIKQVRAYMCEHGIPRSWRSTQSTLASRVVLGEINFGKLVNLAAHPAIVDGETFRRAQAMIVPRGRRAVSDRLLARQDVLRCGTCGRPMVVGSRNKPIKGTGELGRYPMYRCAPTGDCPRRVAISATIAEDVVAAAVREALADAEGRASMADRARAAARDLERTSDALAGAVATLDGFEDVEGARERLAKLRAARDDAQARVNRLGLGAGRRVSASADWDDLSLDARRALVCATVASATVAPAVQHGTIPVGAEGRVGRSADRITVELLGVE